MKIYWGTTILLTKRQLKTLSFCIAGIGLGLGVATTTLAAVEPIDKVVAIVDDDVVLASELRERISQVEANFRQKNISTPPEDVLRQEVLDRLILENIQLQMAYRAGVRISDAQLNQALSRIAEQNKYSLPEFKAALEADGMSYTIYREQIRNEMLINRVQQGNVNRRVQITEQEIANFLDSEEGANLTAPEYRMMHTLIPISSGASKQEIESARAYADTLYQRIRNGEAYDEVVAGSHPFRLSTSDLGWRKKENLPSLLTDLPGTLSEGNTAPPIQSASGFHLVQMKGTQGVAEVIQQTHSRHILLKTSAIRDDKATEQLITELRQRILDGEDFGELARQYSEDIGSALEGGDLGWTSPGQLVKSFQENMDDTALNAVSPAFKTPYGWHILQVLERRNKDVTSEIREKIARNFIHQRKFEDELQAWLQNIRDEAYVDIK